MSDSTEDFNWSNSDSVVVKTLAGIAVYTNTQGDIVIRQETITDFQNEDSFIIIPRDRLPDVIAAIQKELER